MKKKTHTPGQHRSLTRLTFTSRFLVLTIFAAVSTVLTGAVPAGAADLKPTAAVVLGDSTASGEGAGDYARGTNGPVNYCHRSANAVVEKLAIPAISKKFNLACSGAVTGNLLLSGDGQYQENSQTQRLQAIARDNNVRLIEVHIGANDVGFGDVLAECIHAFLSPSKKDCSQTIGATWKERTATVVPRITRALGDIRTVMRNAGYRDSDYQLVVASYASPVTEHMHRFTHALAGCPIRLADAKWGRTVAVPELAEAVSQAADLAYARYLDLSRATENHEACSADSPDWQNPLHITGSALLGADIAGHLAQESFHPNELGTAQIARCFTEFYSRTDQHGACEVGGDGNVHAVTTTT